MRHRALELLCATVTTLWRAGSLRPRRISLWRHATGGMAGTLVVTGSLVWWRGMRGVLALPLLPPAGRARGRWRDHRQVLEGRGARRLAPRLPLNAAGCTRRRHFAVPAARTPRCRPGRPPMPGPAPASARHRPQPRTSPCPRRRNTLERNPRHQPHTTPLPCPRRPAPRRRYAPSPAPRAPDCFPGRTTRPGRGTAATAPAAADGRLPVGDVRAGAVAAEETREPVPAEHGPGGRPEADDRYVLVLLLTTELEVFGSRRGQRAGKFYEVLEQMLASTCRRLPAGPRKSPPPTDRRTASSEEVPRSYIGSGDGRPLLAARRSGMPQAPRSLGDGWGPGVHLAPRRQKVERRASAHTQGHSSCSGDWIRRAANGVPSVIDDGGLDCLRVAVGPGAGPTPCRGTCRSTI
ncbi:hypothetical protein TUE45_01351 [Streptomyces reticuli]|nr:hypothetical protein TUE45_01351 [Streptomyces reticuli]